MDPEENVQPQMPDHTEVLNSIDQNGDHAILQRDQHIQATKDLEMPLEAIAKNTIPKDIQKVKIINSEENPDNDAEYFDDFNKQHEAFMRLMRGPQGRTPKKGVDYFTDVDKKELIDELTPKAITAATPKKGVDYFTPEELTKVAEEIWSMIPQVSDGYTPVKGKDYFDGDPGEPGAPGETPSDEKLMSLIQRVFQQVKEELKGEKGSDGRKLSGQEIIDKIKGKLSYDDLKDLPNLDVFRRSGGASKDYSTRELTDVSMQGIVAGQVLQWDGSKFIPYTPSSTGVNQVFGEVLNVIGTSFTLAHTPVVGTVRLYRNGAYQQSGVGNDYTMSGANGTLTNGVVGTEIFLADYNY